MLVTYSLVTYIVMLVTKMVETVTNILKLSPTHFVPNIDVAEPALYEFDRSSDMNPSKTQVQNNTESLESDKEAINHLFKVLNL